MRRVVLTLAVLALGAHPAAGPRLADPHPCPGVSGFTCSTLAVPLDHSGGRAGSLSLQVAASDNEAAPRGVLLVLTGGPGQPGVQFATRVGKVFSRVLSDYRIVLYDQRGTGAGALQCPALQAAMGSSDLTPPPAGAVRSCARTLGAKRSLYGTDDVVADMELLRQALGVGQVDARRDLVRHVRRGALRDRASGTRQAPSCSTRSFRTTPGSSCSRSSCGRRDASSGSRAARAVQTISQPSSGGGTTDRNCSTRSRS